MLADLGEACEASIKLSYQAHCNNDKPEKIYYISRKQAYHGMSSDNLSLGDRPNLALYNRFHPQNRLHAPEHNYFRHAHKDESPSEYGSRSVQELRSFLLKNDISKIGGLVIETMMGGLVGDVPPSPGYLTGVRNLCDEFNIHLILDEVWCGNGVSGKYFCMDWDHITPDFVFFGKTFATSSLVIRALIGA